jgi:hypothetical protein
MWLGMADPFGNITSMREMDPTLDELSNLLNVLRDNFKAGDIFTVAECHKRAEEWGGPNRQALRDLMIVDGKINTKSFGRLLARFLQRVKDGWYYEPAGKVNNSAAYKLVKKENQP